MDARAVGSPFSGFFIELNCFGLNIIRLLNPCPPACLSAFGSNILVLQFRCPSCVPFEPLNRACAHGQTGVLCFACPRQSAPCQTNYDHSFSSNHPVVVVGTGFFREKKYRALKFSYSKAYCVCMLVHSAFDADPLVVL